MCIRDSLYGFIGNDDLYGNAGADTIHGGPGDDRLYSNGPEAFGAVDANSRLIDIAGSRMFGGEGSDLLVGSNRWDRMQGGPGNDALWGFEGRDYVRGGPGDDLLVPGQNIDDVNGNTGADLIFIQQQDNVTGGLGIDECTRLTPNLTARSCEVWTPN